MSGKLAAALTSVNWNQNVATLCADSVASGRIEQCNLTLALWARELEAVFSGNPAISFVREMQHAGHNVACTLALALYKPAAAGMRSLLESALYFAFFRGHLIELSTLVRDEKYYVSKKDITLFFAKHVADFAGRQAALNYTERLERWYSKTSAIVHGQIPGQWSNGVSVSGISHSASTLSDAIGHFEEAVYLAQSTFICTLGPEIWSLIDSQAKSVFCKGMSQAQRTRLNLDLA